jgi:hypothetical protein
MRPKVAREYYGSLSRGGHVPGIIKSRIEI